MVAEVQRHSVHMFVDDNGKPVPLDEESHKWKMAIKLHRRGVALIADTKIQRMPSESSAQSLAVSLPNQARVDANRTAPAGSEYRYPGASDRSQPTAMNP
ncbi:Pleiotropic regulator 1 [Cricetulus griseus]|uniref:Pleiotropic regulator 1 n=1 Tax=Cricetulus griseus TaxID=10029 RepID=G3I4F8_CRIGR|nr:Pleiotropic regulator 1 [Cricetulus griseus]